MVSNRNINLMYRLCIRFIHNHYRFKRGTAILTSSIGGPRKAHTNGCTNSSPRYSVRTTMLSSFVCLRNFLGFRLNDKHNASFFTNMSWRECMLNPMQKYKNNQKNSVKAIFIFSFLVFYNLNPLFGVLSSFGVQLTPSFSLSS